MARPRKLQQKVDDAKIWLTRHRVDPVDRLCQEATLEYKLSDSEAAHPAITAMLGSGYELVPAPGGGWTLKLGAALRIGIWKSLAEFVYPKLRSSEAKVLEDRHVTVTIKAFEIAANKAPAQSPPIPALNPTRLIDVVTDSDDSAYRNTS